MHIRIRRWKVFFDWRARLGSSAWWCCLQRHISDRSTMKFLLNEALNVLGTGEACMIGRIRIWLISSCLPRLHGQCHAYVYALCNCELEPTAAGCFSTIRRLHFHLRRRLAEMAPALAEAEHQRSEISLGTNAGELKCW